MINSINSGFREYRPENIRIGNTDEETLTYFATIISLIIFAIALIIFVYGIINFFKAGKDKNKLNKSEKIIFYSLIIYILANIIAAIFIKI